MTAGTNTKLTAQKVIEIRQLSAEGWSQPQLARKFDVGPATIGKIVRGEAWRHVTGGIPVVTKQEAELRGLQLATPQGQEFIKTAAQLSFERLAKMAPDLVKNPELLKADPPALNTLPVTSPKTYVELMQRVEMQADQQDGTQLAVENATAKMERTLATGSSSKPAIDAEKLLETLKDEHSNNDSPTVPPATPE